MRLGLFMFNAACLAVIQLIAVPLDARAQCYDYAAGGLRLLGTWPTSQRRINDLEISGDLAFVAEETSSGNSPLLRVLDLTDSTNPVEVGTATYDGTGANTVAVVGDYVLVGDDSAGIFCFDASDPSSPVVVDEIFFGPIPVYEIAVYGSLAYVAASDGFRILEVSLLGELSLVGRNWRRGTGGIVVDGGYAYHAAGAALVIFDVSDPTAPFIAATENTGFGRGVAKVGNLVYVTDSETLGVIDVSDPTVPTFVDAIDLGADCEDLAIDGSLAFVTGPGSFLRVVDLSLPDPEVVAIGAGRGDRLLLDGDRALVTSSSGLEVVSIAPPTSVLSLGRMETDDEVERIEVAGDLAYIASDDEGVEIVDMSDPTAPELIGRIHTSNAQDVAVVGEYAYVAAGDLKVADISIPQAAEIVGSVSLGSGRAVDVVGNLACVGASVYLWTVDVSDPTEPVALGNTVIPGGVSGLQMVGDYAYVASASAGLVIVDISVPAEPVKVTTVPINGNAYDVRLTGEQSLQDLAYVASRGVSIVDVTDPAAPVLRSQVGTDLAYGIDIADDIAYLATREDGMQVFNVSDPDAPVYLGSGWPNWRRAQDVAVSDEYVFFGAERYGTVVFSLQCGDPAAVQSLPEAAPRLIESWPNPSSGWSTVVFELPSSSDVRLEVFDANGRLVRRLATGAREKGFYAIPWDGRGEGGLPVSNGVYWARLEWEGGAASQPISVVR